MKIGTVIGRVTMSKTLKPLEGGRYLIVSPFSREQFVAGLDARPRMGSDPSLVVYDDLGGAPGHVIGYVEGREAAQPFDVPPPIDAINAALVDKMFYNPWKG